MTQVVVQRVGIAGCALALLLVREGHKVTVIELFRDDLAKIPFEGTEKRVVYRFGDEIALLREHGTTLASRPSVSAASEAWST
jgi:2-polyprenyl-6-methoxyphenol hydroxylase-like FAD-dependent oxidoreductase